MNKKRIGIVIAIVLALGLGIIVFTQLLPHEYVPAGDEIALHIQLNTKEDVGLLVFDYRADEHELSVGVSNTDESPIKHNSDIISPNLIT